MRTRLIVLGTACILGSNAVAADLPIIAPVYSTPLYDWNGFYAGVNGGYGGGVFKHPYELIDDGEEDPLIASGSADVTAGGFVAGVQAGYNWQFSDNLMIGLEGDIQKSWIDGRVSLDITPGGGGDTFNLDMGTNLDWFATLRPRIGWVDDRFVVYATGGLAWGQSKSSIFVGTEGDDPLEESITNDRFGWTVGAGIEYALTDSITFKTEYLYTDLGSERIIDTPLGEGEGVPNLTADSKIAFHTVRAGLNFQF